MATVSVHSKASPLTPPAYPQIFLDRKGLALLFRKNVQTPKRWERKKWIISNRKTSGRIIGYDVVQIVGMAARLSQRFKKGPVY